MLDIQKTLTISTAQQHTRNKRIMSIRLQKRRLWILHHNYRPN